MAECHRLCAKITLEAIPTKFLLPNHELSLIILDHCPGFQVMATVDALFRLGEGARGKDLRVCDGGVSRPRSSH
ncbi:hypothetical protein HJFPF1_10132 [Paramyrothecium foliicola]|nr:hypothetical protein HJFPF1_10132 [Paramyrothecium foliicola]